jgi:hypothetical protein
VNTNYVNISFCNFLVSGSEVEGGIWYGLWIYIFILFSDINAYFVEIATTVFILPESYNEGGGGVFLSGTNLTRREKVITDSKFLS